METSTRSESVVRFGNFELNLRTRELFKDGVKLRIRGQPMDVLAILVQHPGDLVTRETLKKQLWPDDTFVDFEHILNNCIGKLRDMLGDEAEAPRFIETLPRLGYRLIAPLTETHQDQIPDSVQAADERKAALTGPTGCPPDTRKAGSRRGWILFVFSALALITVASLAIWHPRRPRPVPQIRSIAVLPFENLSGDPSQEYFADGMTEGLITELGAFGTFRVISRTSVMRMKRVSKPLPKVAQELGVDGIVEGTVAHSGNHFRITVSLLHAATDRHLWANSYESEMEDVLVVQSKVAHSVANAIWSELARQSPGLSSGPRRVNPEAYQAYLEGRYHAGKWTEDGFKKADASLRRSIDLDPSFAPAHSAIASVYSMMAIWGSRAPTEVYPLARAAALKAVELDDELAEGHGVLGQIKLVYDWDWNGAERECQRAVLLNPNSVEAHLWYGQYLTAMGRHEEALRETREAIRLDPVSPTSNLQLAWNFYWARRHDEAISQIARVLELDPTFAGAFMELGWNYAEKRMYAEAIANCRRALVLIPDEQVILGTCGHAFGEAGRRQEASALLAHLQGLAKSEHVDPWYVAQPYDGLGDVDHAMDCLEKAYNERSSGIYLLNVVLFSARLRSDPRFKALLAKLDFPA